MRAATSEHGCGQNQNAERNGRLPLHTYMHLGIQFEFACCFMVWSKRTTKLQRSAHRRVHGLRAHNVYQIYARDPTITTTTTPDHCEQWNPIRRWSPVLESSSSIWRLFWCTQSNWLCPCGVWLCRFVVGEWACARRTRACVRLQRNGSRNSSSFHFCAGFLRVRARRVRMMAIGVYAVRTRRSSTHIRKIRYIFVDRVLHRLPTILKVRLFVLLLFSPFFLFAAHFYLILLLWVSLYFFNFPYESVACQYVAFVNLCLRMWVCVLCVVCHVAYGESKRCAKTKHNHFRLRTRNATAINRTQATGPTVFNMNLLVLIENL